jgi:two-component system NtrC family sensor kinase
MGTTHNPEADVASEKAQSTPKNNRERELLRLIASIIDSFLTADEIQESLVAEISELFQVEVCAFLFLNEDRLDLLIHSGHASPQRLYHLNLQSTEGPIKNCFQNRVTLRDNALSKNANLQLFTEILDITPTSILCAPLEVDEGVLGALVVLNKQNGQFTDQDQEDITILASALARKIHNESTIQKLKISNAELEVIRWQLLNSRNILRALFDSIPTSMYIIDRDYNLAAINMHRAKRNNKPPNQLVGRHCYEALYQRDDPCPDCQVIETLIGGDHTTRTKRLWESELEPLEWEISSYPIHNEDERVVQAILLEQDVTEKRRLEATLAQSEKLAAVGQLAAGLAHEINNPLTAIIANAQLIKRDLPPDDDMQELVDLIALAGSRANQVVRNLLDLARREQYNFAPTDIHQTIRNALSLLQHDVVARSVDLIFEPSDDIPKITASQDHLQGVWLNLLTNAMGSLESDRREIRVETKQQGNEIFVIVADTGKGITPENLSRIFEPFYTTKAPGQGTGLGLSVCHRIIKQHGGRILVDSKPKVGTKFTVILPIS